MNQSTGTPTNSTPQQRRGRVTRWLLAIAISLIGALAAIGAFCILSLVLHGEMVWQ